MASFAFRLCKIQFRPAPAPDGAAYDAPPYPLVGWELIPSPTSNPSTPSASRSRRRHLVPSAHPPPNCMVAVDADGANLPVFICVNLLTWHADSGQLHVKIDRAAPL